MVELLKWFEEGSLSDDSDGDDDNGVDGLQRRIQNVDLGASSYPVLDLAPC